MRNRARVYGNLSPLERAVLNFIKTIVLGALVSGAQAAGPLLQNASLSSVNWSSVGRTFFTAFVMAVALGVYKYNKSFGDPPLPPPPGAASLSPLAVPLSAPFVPAVSSGGSSSGSSSGSLAGGAVGVAAPGCDGAQGAAPAAGPATTATTPATATTARSAEGATSAAAG